MKILVIDDDQDIRDILELVLASEGHEVATAANGLDALERLRAGPKPSVILLDMMMPKLDGEGFLKRMRGDAATKDIPVVVLTGHPPARRKAGALGTLQCLVKPVELDEVLRAVDDAARRPPVPVLPRPI